ncbi:MAG TPA: D-alanyl-D-alanine carboxypeptidase/D-alanyl-D-alanine-endopeptidase [Acidimicrobiales bacterium]|nr:D-alanyl-D-alanine carboxypeptidase/D-alanyl-D-alanine-endopeptidase [Acidimicrobiales bacterium]
MRRPRALAAGVVLVLVAVVAALQDEPSASVSAVPVAAATTTTITPTTTEPSTTTTSSTSTSTTSSSTTTTTTTVPPDPPPPGFVEAVRAALADPRFESAMVGLAVWVEGSGMVLTHNADVALRPGSNEKLLVAWGAYGIIGAGATLNTEVRVDGERDGSALRGDLFLVGGGDPTLRSTGGHSLDRLAAQLRDQGVTEVAGDLVADESGFDGERKAPGWTERHVPNFVGPLSALAVDRNLLRTDPEYLANPALGNMGAFRTALRRYGINVTGGERMGTAPGAAPVVASLGSAPVADLAREMLTYSDNFYAEMLLKEVGRRARGLGTLENGMAAVRQLAGEAGVRLSGTAADGSGLSRDNARPAREWAELLVAARSQPWFHQLVDGLAVGARTGTLANRFHGTPGAGNVRAKTGSVRASRALSGYLTTAGGRPVVFSLVVNSDPVPGAVIPAMDGLVAAMAAGPG